MSSDLAAGDRPVFVVGCPRSGTTLLQVMLSAHPRIALPPETRHLLPTYHRRRRFGDLTDPANRGRVVEFIAADRKFADLGLDLGTVRGQVMAAPPTIGSALGTVLRAYADRFDKPRWGDKQPIYLMEYQVLLALFPDAQIVHLVRDGRACVASLLQMPWWRQGPTAAMTRWVESIRAGNRARAQLRADQYYELRYEDLVAEPGPTAEKLCAFLGEQFDEAMLQPQAVAASAVPRRKLRRHHRRTSEPISAAAVASWRERLEPDQLAVFEAFAREHLTRWGYELTGAGAVSRRELMTVTASLRAREAKFAAKRAGDRAMQLVYRQQVAARLTSGQRALTEPFGRGREGGAGDPG